MAQNTVEIVTIMKLGGAGNMADATSPPQIEIKQITVAATIALSGDLVMMLAVAAGVITKAKTNSVPTAGTAMVTTPAMIAMKQMLINEMGTPFAWATCSSSELNSSGR